MFNIEAIDIHDLLDAIPCAGTTYAEWAEVGMALKEEGYPLELWDEWSATDTARYKPGECAKKWRSFKGGYGASPVAGGTIYQMAVERGYRPPRDDEDGFVFGWDDNVSLSGIVRPEYVERKDVSHVGDWDPVREMTRYLETLFERSDYVGYVNESYENEKGKFIPANKGVYGRTAGELLDELAKCKGDTTRVFGATNPKGGAWIRFNPLDGQGVGNANVTAFRYALVESDNMDITLQRGMYEELQLPIKLMIHSGGKSLHAIVKIDADDAAEYRKRVDYLYKVCKDNGIVIDTQNRNPSRLSRLPGVMRNGNRQYIVSGECGQSSWQAWVEHIAAVKDDLPDTESLADKWTNMPPLAEELIQGVLRKGHKMLLAGPSKAGKSFLQIELAICIAEGKPWLGWNCAQGRVMYVNLELDEASCFHRFKDVYEALGFAPDNIKNIDIWNLRGKTVPMDKLAPMLIRRARKHDYVAVIIDPIYKVLTGDENSASEMAKFCNQFDKICAEIQCATIYCHHHSKGLQGGKVSMDRASGSGVFARDPDAQLDMIELPLSDAALAQKKYEAGIEVIRQWIRDNHPDWHLQEAMGDYSNPTEALNNTMKLLGEKVAMTSLDRDILFNNLQCAIDAAGQSATTATAWRIEGTLREFPKFAPKNLWFDYPRHILDESGVLADIRPEAEKPAWQKKERKKKPKTDPEEMNNQEILEAAFSGLEMTMDDPNEGVEIARLVDAVEHAGYKFKADTPMSSRKRTVGTWIKKVGSGFIKDEKGIVRRG